MGCQNVKLLLRQPLANIKAQLRPGMSVSYFDSEENRVIDAEVVNVKRTNVSLLNKHDNRRWNVPYSMLFSVMDGGCQDTGTGLLIEGEVVVVE